MAVWVAFAAFSEAANLDRPIERPAVSSALSSVVFIPYAVEWALAAVLLGLVGSALFTMFDQGLFSLDEDELAELKRSHPLEVRRIAQLLDDPMRTWFTLLAGSALFNLLLALGMAWLVVLGLGKAGLAAWVLAGLAAVAAVMVLGESLPSLLASRQGDALVVFAARCAPYMRFVLAPIVLPVLRVAGLVGGARREGGWERIGRVLEVEKRLLVQIGGGEVDVALEDEEREMIDHALEFGERTARDVMTPRSRIVALDTRRPHDEVLRFLRETTTNRLPVYRESLDNVVGVLHRKQVLLNPEKDYHEQIADPLFVSEEMDLIELMAFMKNQHCHLVVVLDDYGATAGIVTMNNLLEALVGDRLDEHSARVGPESQQ